MFYLIVGTTASDYNTTTGIVALLQYTQGAIDGIHYMVYGYKTQADNKYGYSIW